MHICSRLTAIPLACSLFAFPITAQEGMGPAPEVKRFHPLLGVWEGSGTVRPQPGITMKWTATSHNTKVLGGHFVQEDLRIKFEGAEAPPPMVFRNLHGFDQETKRWMSYSISNLGTADVKQVHWVHGKMMTGGSKVEPDMTGKNQFIIERWSTTFGKDSYSVAAYETVGNGKPFAHVTGTFKRVKSASASLGIDKVAPMVPVPKQMEPLEKWVGTYRMKGWMIMMAGSPKMDISATEVVATVLGGTVLEFRLQGDSIPGVGSYQGYGAMVWNAQDRCYKSLRVDNMGGGLVTDAYLRDGKLISGVFRVSMGQPVVMSSVLALAEDGSLGKITEHSAYGADAPVQTFHATYSKK